MVVKSFGSHTGEEVVENVYTSELVGNSGIYSVPLENKFTQCIYFGLCRGRKGKCVVQEEDGENRLI